MGDEGPLRKASRTQAVLESRHDPHRSHVLSTGAELHIWLEESKPDPPCLSLPSSSSSSPSPQQPPPNPGKQTQIRTHMDGLAPHQGQPWMGQVQA